MSVYMYAYTFTYARVWVYICTRVGTKGRSWTACGNVSHERRVNALLGRSVVQPQRSVHKICLIAAVENSTIAYNAM